MNTFSIHGLVRLMLVARYLLKQAENFLPAFVRGTFMGSIAEACNDGLGGINLAADLCIAHSKLTQLGKGFLNFHGPL